MAAGFLIDPSRRDVRVPVGRSLVVGRTGECGYVIYDAAASRNHMEIVAHDGGFVWRDLDSTNGVYVNERKLPAGELATGDRIRIGSTVLLFEVDQDAVPTIAPKPLAKDTSELIVEHLGRDTEERERTEADVLLEAVHAVMNDIASNYEPCGLVDRILETTMKAIDAQRGAVFFSLPGTESLHPCAICGHVHMIEAGVLKHADVEALRISQTVARRVLKHGESVLVQDTGQAGDLDASASIMALDLRSIICAPIRGKYGVLGILYIDSDRPEHRYSRAHMLLSTAVGNSAGLALENARLHHEILQKQRSDQELEFAGIIQEGFLIGEWPNEDPRYGVFGETRPAKVVGGDFYDVVALDEERVGILVGDVSGKGVPSALAMAQTLAEFRVHATGDVSPLEIVVALNASLCERSQRGMFCTLSYVTLDLSSGKAISANAGHHPVLRANRQEVDEVGLSTGPPIGIFPDMRWTQTEFILSTGDTIYLYTDGIVEARSNATAQEDSEGPDEYGEGSLKVLAGELVGESPDVVVREVLKDVQRFTEPADPHDDCTLLVLRYNG